MMLVVAVRTGLGTSQYFGGLLLGSGVAAASTLVRLHQNVLSQRYKRWTEREKDGPTIRTVARSFGFSDV